MKPILVAALILLNLPASGYASVRVVSDGENVRGVQFLDAHGALTKQVKFDGIRVRAIVSGDSQSCVVWEESRNPDSSLRNVKTTWFSSEGQPRCKLETVFQPWVLSATADTLVMVKPGREAPDDSGPQYGADLEVIDEHCQTLFSTSSAYSSWKIVLISPTGKWLALQNQESTRFEDKTHRWRDSILSINLEARGSFSTTWYSDENLNPFSITDKGVLLAKKFKIAEKGPIVNGHKTLIRHFSIYDWPARASGFTDSGTELTEK